MATIQWQDQDIIWPRGLSQFYTIVSNKILPSTNTKVNFVFFFTKMSHINCINRTIHLKNYNNSIVKERTGHLKMIISTTLLIWSTAQVKLYGSFDDHFFVRYLPICSKFITDLSFKKIIHFLSFSQCIKARPLIKTK